MKKILLLAVLFTASFARVASAQSASTPSPLAGLLSFYYDIKNALINGDTQTAGIKAGDFLNALNGVDMKALPEADMDGFMSYQNKLAVDAKNISESKDIAHQREYFANFSSNFFKLAKAVKLTDQVVYYAYCPMKKSYWLSADAAIKNPYFGKQMLTCGKVSETLNK